MRRMIKMAILTALAISISTPLVGAQEYMALDTGKQVTITDENGQVLAPAAVNQKIAHVGTSNSPAYSEVKQKDKTISVTNLKDKQVIATQVDSVIYSDYDYIALKLKGSTGYQLYTSQGKLLNQTTFDVIDSVSDALFLASKDTIWTLYRVSDCVALNPDITNWIPNDDAKVIVGVKTENGLKGDYDVTENDDFVKVFYDFKGNSLSKEEAIRQIEIAADKKATQAVQALPIKETSTQDTIPMPSSIANGRHTIAQVVAPFSEGIAFVKAEDKKIYAINPKGDILFIPEKYDSIEPYNQGLAMVGRKTHSLNLGGILNTVLAVGGIVSAYNDNYYYDNYGYSHRHHRYYASPYYYDPYDYNGIYIDTSSDYRWTQSMMKHGYIDHSGREVISSKNDAVCPITPYGIMVYNKGLYGVFDTKGQAIIPMQYSNLIFMNQHKSYIAQDASTQKYGILGANNETRLPFQYDALERVSRDQLKAQINKLWHLVTPANNYAVSSYGYKSIDPIANATVDSTMMPAKEDKDIIMIDTKTGAKRFALPEGSKEVTKITKEHIVFKGKKGYGVLDYKGRVVVPPSYKNITVVPERNAN